MDKKRYERELKRLHVELVKLQEWVIHAGLKVCVVFEGRDTAGKGGTIKALTARVNPRTFRVVALPAPSEREKSQMYVQRYIRQRFARSSTRPMPLIRRKITENRSSFPNDEALLKRFYPALRSISPTWTMPIRDWKAALTRITPLPESKNP